MDKLLTIIFTFLIDIIYLSFFGGKEFLSMVNKIQNSESNIKYISALFAYIFIIIVIYKFIILENKSPLDAFILGLCIYGIFDTTNYALFNNYSLDVAIKDTLWGGFLFYLVTIFVRHKFIKS